MFSFDSVKSEAGDSQFGRVPDNKQVKIDLTKSSTDE
jgi:hypothetical protein